jgi:hypothetical protein
MQKQDMFSKKFEENFAAAILNEEYEKVGKAADDYYEAREANDDDSFGTDDSMKEKKPSAHVSSGVVAMHATGHTTVFPREDNVYTMKQSFPFDEIQTKIW